MTKVVLGILIVAAGADMAQGQPLANARSVTPFHWDNRAAERLDVRHTVANEGRLSSRDRAALIEALAAQMRDWGLGSEQRVREIAVGIPIKLIDLNGDGRPEIIAQLLGVPSACGAPGNCIVWVFRREKAGYSLLLDDEAQVFRIQPGHGYRDIVLSMHMSAFDSELTEFKFDGKQYRAGKCYDFEWSDAKTGRDFKKPHVTPCKR